MLDELDNVFDDHPSLDASLEDFENNSNSHRSPVFGLPSQHSGFRSEDSDGEIEEPTGERWSPPGLRQHDYVQGSAWYRHQPYLRKSHPNAERLELKPTIGLSSPSPSREPSPQYEDALEGPAKAHTETGDLTVAANVPLPPAADTPQKGRSLSPGPGPARNADATPRNSSERDGLDFGTETLSNCRRCLLHLQAREY